MINSWASSAGCLKYCAFFVMLGIGSGTLLGQKQSPSDQSSPPQVEPADRPKAKSGHREEITNGGTPVGPPPPPPPSAVQRFDTNPNVMDNREQK